jgi:hypothetical protein
MTIKEFADKYSLDYTTVYNAAKLISPLNMALWRREYDENDGVRYYIKVSDKGAICAFDYYEKLSKNPVVYTHFTIDDQMVDEVPKVRAKEWVKGDTSFEDVMTLIRELTKGE